MAEKQKAPTSGNGEFSPCACSRFFVLTNLRDENEQPVWDEEWRTDCGGGKTKSTFLPGHDAKLKSLLIRAGIGGHEVTEEAGALNLTGDAVTTANKFGFAHMVEDGIKRGLEKLAAKSSKSQTRAAKKAAAPAAKKMSPSLAATVAKEEKAHQEATAAEQQKREKSADWSDEGDQMVKAKVGRWEYLGKINPKSKAFHYTSNSGDKKVAKEGKYALVES